MALDFTGWQILVTQKLDRLKGARLVIVVSPEGEMATDYNELADIYQQIKDNWQALIWLNCILSNVREVYRSIANTGG